MSRNAKTGLFYGTLFAKMREDLSRENYNEKGNENRQFIRNVTKLSTSSPRGVTQYLNGR